MVETIGIENAERDNEKTRLIIAIDMPRNFPAEDEALLKRYLQSIREDIRWHMGSLQHHVIGTDVVLVNNSLIDHDILDRLKQYHNLTVPPPVVSGSTEWHDLPTILKKKALEYSTPATLVSIQPLKQAYIQQPLAHQIDVDFVGQQAEYVAHYAALIHEDVATYLLERRQDHLAFVEVYKQMPEQAQRVKELAKIAAQQSVPMVNVDRFLSRSVTPFDDKISGLDSMTLGLSAQTSFQSTPLQNTSTIRKHVDNVVTTFTNTTDIMRRFGGNPCDLHHLVGGCRKTECTHLHDQIRFTPEALQQYRLYLRVQLCPYGINCAYSASGKCFFGHTCPAGSDCIRPGCPHEHGVKSVPAKQPPGLFQGPLHVPIDRWQIGSEKQTSLASPGKSSSDTCRSLQSSSRIFGHQPTILALNFPKLGARSQSYLQSRLQSSMSTCLPFPLRAHMKLICRSHRPKDSIPLIKAIFDCAQARGTPRISRTHVGLMIRGKHDYPIGLGKYIDFGAYSHAAARHGYVTLGPNELLNNGQEWIQSTGKLETACGVRPY